MAIPRFPRAALRRLAAAVFVLGLLPTLSILAGGVSASAAPVSRTVPGAWVWPIAPRPVVVHRFAPPEQRWEAGHRGVDLGTVFGAPVRSAGAGVVGFAGVIGGKPVVTVVHGALRTTYEPVVATVRVGQAVLPGEPIGLLAVVGGHCLPRACLHWGLLRGHTYLDPLTLVGAGPIRLLPTGTVRGLPTGALGLVSAWRVPPPSGAAAAADVPGPTAATAGPMSAPEGAAPLRPLIWPVGLVSAAVAVGAGRFRRAGAPARTQNGAGPR